MIPRSLPFDRDKIVVANTTPDFRQAGEWLEVTVPSLAVMRTSTERSTVE